MDQNEILMEKALALLSSGLTEDERETLMSIKHDLNASIRWGKVVEEAFGPIVESVENIIFHGGKEFVKNGGDRDRKDPVDSLFDNERTLLEEGDKAQLSKHFVTLLLTKKLLGALKTKTNQALANIQTITFEEEYAALGVLDGEPAGDKDIETEAHEETGEMRDETEAEILASLGLDESWNCQHARTIVRRRTNKNNPCRYLETYCKDCNSVVKRASIGESQPGGKKRKPKTEKCKHKYFEWVPGEEGQAAQCADKAGCPHVLTAKIELERINWEKAGLEPYGDDPGEDEVTIL